MSLYQATFRLRHECPYRELSGRFPDITIREWYLSDCQVLEVSTTDRPSAEVIAAIEQLGAILHRSVDESGLHVVTKACLCQLENSIIDRFQAHNCLYQPPTIHRHGWEQYSLLAFDESDISALHADLESDREIDVISKTRLEQSQIPHSMLTPVDQLFESVTDRQLAALQIALDHGYYEVPRRCSIDELAAHTTVARSTFEEHLRKAENKLIRNAGHYITLLSESGRSTDLRKEPVELSVGRV